ncbi:histidine phosphatase family protein [Cellulomonas cellasea]|uniref:Phosphoglycerate kinase n=2 Tax=Cellulomonas cellasea TaxID=43670 RepID=A0A0A0B9R4_9CELL|nr:histidine phosphatase family protein [Cellulomonas cellasea]KGM03630.1 phosphoglycerate kinase [Cellulomonas cellasea DSM 20118]GEA87470.1 putative phosphoglycerate mutase [Cellulomonas cellasea]
MQPPPTPDLVGPRARTLWLVTHTEASHHVDGLVGGWFDSALTARGEREAALVGQALRRQVPHGTGVEVVTSDLRRARQTADAVGDALGVTPTLDARLREKSYGVAGGRPQAWLEERFVVPPASGDRLRHDEGVEGAETWLTFARRVYAGVTDLLARAREHQVLVAHGGSGQLVVAAWLGIPVEATGYARFRLPAGSITVLREDGRFHSREVAELGSTAHLRVTG